MESELTSLFILKKIIASMLMPLPVFLLMGFIGLGLVMFSHRHILGCITTLMALIGIFLISFQPITTPLLKSTERLYKPFIPTEKSIDYIVVLGSGHVVDKDLPLTSELSRAGLMRLAEGIRILRLYPNAKLLLSGYGGGSSISNARMMAKVAVALGVANSDIILFESARNTQEEAQLIREFVDKPSLVLVTSASHMQRAMNEFHLVGLDPLPAPTNFLATDNITQYWERYTPSARYLEQTERMWHETLGRSWQWLSDYIANYQTQADEEKLATIE